MSLGRPKAPGITERGRREILRMSDKYSKRYGKASTTTESKDSAEAKELKTSRTRQLSDALNKLAERYDQQLENSKELLESIREHRSELGSLSEGFEELREQLKEPNIGEAAAPPQESQEENGD